MATKTLETKISDIEEAQKELDAAKRLARHTTSGPARSDDFYPATKEQMDLAKKKLTDSTASSEVLFCHVGNPLVVEGFAVFLGSEGAGDGRGFYAKTKGNASASKVAADEGEGGEDATVAPVATGSSAKAADKA